MLIPDPRPRPSWCLFQIEARPYAVGLESVAEIVEAESLVRLPLGSARILGLCNFRRDVVPVIALDAPASLASGGGQAVGRPIILVLKAEPGTWGLRIDRGGTTVAEAPLEESDDEPGRVEPGAPVLRGTVWRGEVAHAVLDPEATWRSLREALQRWFRGDLGPDPTPNPISISRTAPRAEGTR